MHLSRYAANVTVVVRGQTRAETMSRYLQKELAATKNVSIRLDAEGVDGGGDVRLEHVELRGRSSGDAERLAASGLFVLIGAVDAGATARAALARRNEGSLMTPLVAGITGALGAWTVARGHWQANCGRLRGWQETSSEWFRDGDISDNHPR
jgi:thioredoxin reductase (NADPH)